MTAKNAHPTLVHTVLKLRAQVAAWRKEGLTVGLVPTMGALHEGHLSLVDLMRGKVDRAVVSIFVNPTQFAPHEDFDAYPRNLDRDAETLGPRAHLIFAPTPAEMYPQGFSTSVHVAGVSEPLEGQFRPTHFSGVATIVSKLLLAALPDVAAFGEKDWQQLQVIRRMASDLNIPVEILGGAILREADGLAMSSRNVYLSPEERKAAGQLNVILRETAAKAASGAIIPEATREGVDRIRTLGFDHVDYLEIRDASSLAEFVTGRVTSPARILLAAKIGRTRLIDNMPV